jgi:hypothetical protein
VQAHRPSLSDETVYAATSLAPEQATPVQLLALWRRHWRALGARRRLRRGREVWGREYRDEVEYVRVYIRRLRRKLEDDPNEPYYIVTERGTGYRFRNPRDAGAAASAIPTPSSTPSAACAQPSAGGRLGAGRGQTGSAVAARPRDRQEKGALL